jgi:hypothetical protein
MSLVLEQVAIQKIIKKVINHLQEFVADRQHKFFLPDAPRADDIYLASYPRSGNTWLSFLIANAIREHYGLKREVGFFSILDIIPSVHFKSKDINPQGLFGCNDLPRIIKSHCGYNPYYNRVIFLVRDPRKVLVSYYQFLRERKFIPESQTLSDFIRTERYGAKRWSNHAKGWYLSYSAGQIIQVFLYEDFAANPQAQLSRLMDLLGLQLSETELQAAVEASSKENMQKSQDTHRSTYLIKELKASFVNPEQSGKDQALSDEDRKFIEDETREIAQMLGYNY